MMISGQEVKVNGKQPEGNSSAPVTLWREKKVNLQKDKNSASDEAKNAEEKQNPV